MVKTNVFGSIGLLALSNPPLELLAQMRTLKSLRDLVEDRLESRFDVFAQLGTSAVGNVDLSIADGQQSDLLAEMIIVAADCVAEFNAVRVAVPA
jgi:hypothetical protein